MIVRGTNIRRALRARQRGFIINPYAFGAAVDSNVILHLHGDGSDGDTATVDSSSYGSPVTLAGLAKLSSTQAKFGATSINSPTGGAGSCVTTSYNNANRQLAALDFTYTFFFYKPTGGATFANFLSTRNNTSGTAVSIVFGDLVASDRMAAWIAFDGVATWGLKLNSGVTYSRDAWHWVTVTRSGNNFELRVDGTSRATGTLSGSIDHATTTSGSISLFDGTVGQFVDEVYVIKNTVLDCSVVPTSPF